MPDTQAPDPEPPVVPAEPQSKTIVYCGVCGLPPEYCEFGGLPKKCQEWLEKNHREMYEKLWSEDALASAAAHLTPDALKRAQKDTLKKAAKAEAAEARALTKRSTSMVTIKRVERNKRKFVTCVAGLEAFGLSLKAVSKELGKKFATGSSVTKVASGGEEIVVQGDVSGEVEEWLLERYAEIPGDNVELVEDKKKKGAAGPG